MVQLSFWDDIPQIEAAEAEFYSQVEDSADSGDGEDDEYSKFVDKFKSKKTTDDCYTPPNIYDVVAAWVETEYKVPRSSFARPFYPGGDYQMYKYPPGCVVVDNPPFSILAEINRFYVENSIKFFLFAPALTMFSSSSSSCCCIGVGASIVYENGAEVNTSFITNLDKARIRTAPSLYEAVNAANGNNLKSMRRQLPKYEYPAHVLTAARLNYLSKYGVDFKAGADETLMISELDEQKELDKSIFGYGYLLSDGKAAEKAAAEKAAAEKAAAGKAAAKYWKLSERELHLVRLLSKGKEDADVA